MDREKLKELEEIIRLEDKTLKIRKILAFVIGEENVDHWLNAPHPDFGYRTPQSLMNEEEWGVECVHDALMATLDGQFS